MSKPTIQFILDGADPAAIRRLGQHLGGDGVTDLTRFTHPAYPGLPCVRAEALERGMGRGVLVTAYFADPNPDIAALVEAFFRTAAEAPPASRCGRPSTGTSATCGTGPPAGSCGASPPPSRPT